MFPWWAVALLPLQEGSKEWMVRNAVQQGYGRQKVFSHDENATIWSGLVRQANELAERKPIEEWRAKAWEEREAVTNDGKPGPIAVAVREAGLWSPRAFCQFVSLLDDEGEGIELADFHIIVVRAMRQWNPTAIFLPLEHGKSWINSILVPLMDWAEWNNSTSCRVFWNQAHQLKWSARLMGIVEYGDDITQIYPWIRKPTNDDRSKRWSMDGFAIGGRTLPDASFESLTARGYSTGNRYSRTGCDDWVTTGNCQSIPVQDRLDEYFRTGPMTMGQKVRRQSKFGTAWGSTFYCGTFFTRFDVGYRTYHEFAAQGYKVLRYDVFPDVVGTPNDSEVLWPEARPKEYIDQMKRRLGTRVFNMRMRNMVVDEGMQTFPEEAVEKACQENYHFGEIPANAQSIICFDPASGSTTRYAADPAIAIYSEVDDPAPEPEWGQLPDLQEKRQKAPRAFTSHFVEWKRLIGFDFPKQCNFIIAWARARNLPVVIESNNLQRSYKEMINKMAPDVKVHLRRTGEDIMDPDEGIETFGPIFENDRAIIHSGGAPPDELKALTTQLIEWPQVRKKDVLVAFWFGRYFLQRRQRRNVSSRMAVQLPGYVEDHLWFWDQAG